MKRYLETVIKIFIYAIFFTPLIVIPSSFIFPFIVPKILAMRTLITLMLGAYVLLLIINWKEYRPHFTPLNLVLLGFLASFIISTFVGVDPYHSFWDNHERMLGLFTIIHFVIFYFIATAVFKNWTDWKWALRIFLLGGGIVMLIGIMQKWVNPEMLLNFGSDRVGSTLGNSIYVGGFGLFLAFVSYLLYVKEKNSIMKIVLAIGAIMSILGLFYSGSRGAMLGLGAGIATLLFGYFLVFWKNLKVRYSLLGIFVLMVATVGLLINFRATDFVKNIPAIGRTVNTGLSDLEASARWKAWVAAIKGWEDHPVFGWGPNNYFYAFNLHYNPRQLEHGYGETWFDNAHNIIVNTLTVQGAVGLVLYLSIFVIGIVSLILARRRYGLELHLAVVGSAFLVAHLIGNITVFENPTSYLYFMFWLAFINQICYHTPVQPDNNAKNNSGQNLVGKNRTIGSGALLSAGIVCALVIFLFEIQPARANVGALKVLRVMQTDLSLAIPVASAEFNSPSPHIDDVRADIARNFGQSLPDRMGKTDPKVLISMFDLIYTELQKNLSLHPLDIRNQLTLSQLAQQGAQLKNDDRYFLEQEKYLTDALKYSPKRQQVIYSLSTAKLILGKKEEAISLLEGALGDDPAIPESYWRLALLYDYIKEHDKAMEILDLADKNNVNWDDTGKKVVEQLTRPQTVNLAPKTK